MLDSIDDASAMPQTRILDDLSARISEFLAASPAKDVEKNLQALLSAAFAALTAGKPARSATGSPR